MLNGVVAAVMTCNLSRNDEQERYIACMGDLCNSLQIQVSVFQQCIQMNPGLPTTFVHNIDNVTSRLMGSIESCKMDLRSSCSRPNGNGMGKGSWFSCLPGHEVTEQRQDALGCLPALSSRGCYSGGTTSMGPKAMAPREPHAEEILADVVPIQVLDKAESRLQAEPSSSKNTSKRSSNTSCGKPSLREAGGMEADLRNANMAASKSDSPKHQEREGDEAPQASEPPEETRSNGQETRSNAQEPRSNGLDLEPQKVLGSKVKRMTLSEQIELDERELDGEDSPAGKFVDGVMNPNWPGRLGWDILVILLVLVDAMVLPFQMAYKDGDPPNSFDNTWMWITTAFFVVDMWLSFFTAYTANEKEPGIAPGKLVTSKARIARHYIRTWFPIDFTSTIPWGMLGELVSGGGSGKTAQMAKLTKIVKFVRFLRLMRMLRLAKLAMIWEKIEAQTGSVILKQSVALLRVVLVLVGICHWNACIWWMIGQPRSLITELMSDQAQEDYANLDHWTTIKRPSTRGVSGSEWSWLEDRDLWDQYIFCFYWTLGVMRTMPSEVHPVNKPERLYVMVFMFFAFSMFAICVALITQTFFKFSERKRVFDDDMAQVRMYMRNLKSGGASEKLQEMVKSFLQHLFEQRKIHAKEVNMLNILPRNVQQQLQYERIGHYLLKLPLVSALPPKAALYVSNVSEIIDVPAGSCLSRRGRTADAAWILMSGRLMMSRSDLTGPLTQDTSVDVVDAHCLIVAQATSNRTVHAVTCAVCIKIDKSKFVEMMETHEDFSKALKVNFEDEDDELDLTNFGHATTSFQQETMATTAAIVAS